MWDCQSEATSSTRCSGIVIILSHQHFIFILSIGMCVCECLYVGTFSRATTRFHLLIYVIYAYVFHLSSSYSTTNPLTLIRNKHLTAGMESKPRHTIQTHIDLVFGWPWIVSRYMINIQLRNTLGKPLHIVLDVGCLRLFAKSLRRISNEAYQCSMCVYCDRLHNHYIIQCCCGCCATAVTAADAVLCSFHSPS